MAEALRRTMTDYISKASDDYLAHPRFWAAFAIAGDEAIRPLDGLLAAARDLIVAIKANGSRPTKRSLNSPASPRFPRQA